ncbi:MAG: tryptophan--tRNA ligase, partial [Bacteroidota bacterium]|nr:tryptophan--tRNA ligase [Bacteroidota bacterium]
MKTVLSGMRATSRLHLGNYFGAAANWLRMQEEYNCYFFVADLHALTTDHDPKALNHHTKTIFAHYLGLGLNPEKCTLYIQSDVPEIIELYLVLNMFANKGELEKTASFKEKARKKGQSLN